MAGGRKKALWASLYGGPRDTIRSKGDLLQPENQDASIPWKEMEEACVSFHLVRFLREARSIGARSEGLIHKIAELRSSTSAVCMLESQEG